MSDNQEKVEHKCHDCIPASRFKQERNCLLTKVSIYLSYCKSKIQPRTHRICTQAGTYTVQKTVNRHESWNQKVTVEICQGEQKHRLLPWLPFIPSFRVPYLAQFLMDSCDFCCNQIGFTVAWCSYFEGEVFLP